MVMIIDIVVVVVVMFPCLTASIAVRHHGSPAGLLQGLQLDEGLAAGAEGPVGAAGQGQQAVYILVVQDILILSIYKQINLYFVPDF